MSSYKLKKTDGDTSWFVNDRFGMFIHFGLYSMPARHEWIKSLEEISEIYQEIFGFRSLFIIPENINSNIVEETEEDIIYSNGKKATGNP